MHKTVFKLRSQLVLGATLATFALPGKSEASLSHIGMITGGYNFFPTKTKLNGLKYPAMDDKSTKITELKDVGEYDGEMTEAWRGIDFMLGFNILWQMSDIFSVGLCAGGGLSFARQQLKSWKSMTVSEDMVFKVGIAMRITDWVLLNLAARFSQLRLEVNYTDNEKKLVEQFCRSKDNGYLKDSVSKADLAVGLSLDAHVLIPITENLKAVITIGGFGDMKHAEFKELKHCHYIPARTNVPAEWKEDSSLSTKLEGRFGIRAGVGIALEF